MSSLPAGIITFQNPTFYSCAVLRSTGKFVQDGELVEPELIEVKTFLFGGYFYRLIYQLSILLVLLSIDVKRRRQMQA